VRWKEGDGISSEGGLLGVNSIDERFFHELLGRKKKLHIHIITGRNIQKHK
jgi:hypothetical protein